MNVDGRDAIYYDVTLVDGNANGLIEIKTDLLVCYKLSKEFFDSYKDDDDIKAFKSVYVLYGKGKFYVGKADIRRDGTAITSRIDEHLKKPEEDFIEEIVFFCDENNTWDGEINYLEAALIRYFKDNNFPMFKKQRDETVDDSIDNRKRGKYQKLLNTIITLLDMLGYLSIASALKDYDKNKKEITDEKIPVIISSSKIINNKPEAKTFLLSNGIDLGDSDSFSYSGLNTDGSYSIDVQISLLQKDWTVVLNDTKDKIIRVFIVPQRVIKNYGIDSFRDKDSNNKDDKRKSISINKDQFTLSKRREVKKDRLCIADYIVHEISY